MRVRCLNKISRSLEEAKRRVRIEHTVLCAFRNDLLSPIESACGISERIMVLRLSTTAVLILSIFFVCAPTLQSSAESKDEFCVIELHSQLCSSMHAVRSRDRIG